ncbi:MAG TPA: hypothetical protein VGO58_09920 [Chitinophagaceae bacterium]|jgi:hypothetical protein|nr:hypothetical protein [Chitinophagaceae bacterium]
MSGGSKFLSGNLFIPEIIFTNHDFDALKMPGNVYGTSVDSTVGKMELWQTLLKFDNTENFHLQEALRTSSVQKRNIFIGSFNHAHDDVHKTLYGDIDGGIIMINIYYNLLLHGNEISFLYNLFLVSFFFVVFLMMFYTKRKSYQYKSLVMTIVAKIILKKIHYIILLLTSLLSSLFFNKASNTIVLLVAVFATSNIVEAYKIYKARKLPGQASP